MAPETIYNGATQQGWYNNTDQAGQGFAKSSCGLYKAQHIFTLSLLHNDIYSQYTCSKIAA